ncbi:secondary thiamine-phosphate synthase enzyme YjbQ [Simiduia sp. 21SJ11W-1]|uniref:secondary thiamine-phosphate synthase enzyme YjbQ n=1 Tax=Simiduia sp. 21SJ11W-1 TaxID=2909669 RepID=UPI0035322581
MIIQLTVATPRQGLHSITDQVRSAIAGHCPESGLCSLFVRHTSASLLVQENYDITAQQDLEAWLNRLVPEDDPLYTHTLEGADDMPAHIKSMLTAVNLSVPIIAGELALGTWQGIYLWEHRHGAHQREIVIHLGE